MSHRPTRWVTSLCSLAVISGGLVATGGALAGPAAGATSAVAPTSAAPTAAVATPLPDTVTADALPTVQINGVAWAQVTVGNTVYVTGNFSSARPAGAKAGTSETRRTDLLAYDIRSGNLITSFAHTLNGQGQSIAASPDGTRVYVSGEFTTVDGQTRNRVAAFDTATGALVAGFAPSFNSRVGAISATNTTVYAGGIFTTANGVSRQRIAAVAATNGATLSWAPTIDNGRVNALVVSPDASRVIVGGSFTAANGQNAYGLAALATASGALQPWAATSTIRNAGNNAAVLSLKTDGTSILGTGYVYGSGGNFEGSFAADPTTGKIAWMEDCHGDSYDVFGTGRVAYVASHEHACDTVPGGFPQTTPWTFHRSTAFTDYATGTLAHNAVSGYNDFAGQPAPTQLNWYPTLATGTFTGQSQAAWAVTGNGSYVALGGEFPSVNNTAQQGLVRFAVRSVAPNKVGPVGSAGLTPTAVSLAAGKVRVSWQETSDADDTSLTYQVIRDSNTAKPAYTTTTDAKFFQTTQIGFTDTGLAPGSTHTYRVVVRDPSGNAVSSATTTAKVTAAAPSAYAQRVQADGPTDYWRLGESSGSIGYNQVGFDDLALGSGTTRGTAGALAGDPDTATAFDGTANGTAATTSAVPGPATFSVAAWFRTTSTSGGKIVGFGNSATGTSSSYDRHAYLDNAGHVVFGIYDGSTRTVASPDTYNDGRWHQLVATVSAAGTVLYVDGTAVGHNGYSNAQSYGGYWRIGGDNLNGWPARPSSTNLAGDIDEVAVYPVGLSADQVATQDQIGTDPGSGPAPVNTPPTASFTTTTSGLTATFDGTGSNDPDGTVAGYAWTLGDGATATGATPKHTYPAAGDQKVTLTVTDNDGATATTTKTVTVTAPNTPPTASFTATTSGLTATFDGTGSSDPDGTVAGYAWTLGDGATATGATPKHTYPAAGDQKVTLTVTDNDGATATTTKTVTVTAPAPPASADTARDTFARTSTNGLGKADVGGAWAVYGTAAGNFSVSGGAAALKLPTAGLRTGAYLPSVSTDDADTTLALTTDKANDQTIFASVIGRRVGTNTEYRGKLRLVPGRTVGIQLTRLAGSTSETVIGPEVYPTGLTFTPGNQLRVRLQVTGTNPTTLRMKVWPAGTDEPAAWTVSATDSTAVLQAAGSVGVTPYISGAEKVLPVSLLISDLAVKPTA